MEKVVGVGGINDKDNDGRDIVEIYNVEENSWKRLSDLPKGDRFLAAIVPHEKSFLMVGGHLKKGYSTEVLKFEESTESWITVPSHLSVARRSAFAMLVSPDIFPSC